MTLIVDSSAVIAALVSSGPDGDWSRTTFRDQDLAAPTLMVYEVANVLRRHAAASLIARDSADAALELLLAMPIRNADFHGLARRAWELRHNFTIFDASYIALAEAMDATLVTLDRRLTRAHGITCPVLAFEPA
jgi:predicted nucleic acid-binding protein